MPSAKDTPDPATTPDDAKRRARRERKRERSREEILEAARKVLLRKGFTATTLETVAREVGVTKPALYYYFPSKDALLFELMFESLERHAKAVEGAVAKTGDGAQALRALIRESVELFAPHMDDFRLAYLYGQVASQGSLHFNAEQFARIRPLNELWFAGTTERLEKESGVQAGGKPVEPRLMAFLAYLAAIGLLTMKGMVESVNDPLIYSDDQLIDGFGNIFEAAVSAMTDK
jgi:AcrR family transcriptional regulator